MKTHKNSTFIQPKRVTFPAGSQLAAFFHLYYIPSVILIVNKQKQEVMLWMIILI